MLIEVDLDWCQGNGMCVLEAPEVFALSDHGKALFETNVDDSLRSKVEAAVDACPTQSIVILDS
jgi:ferredoxin